MALTDNPDYRLRRIGESEPDLFTQWYNKYIKNLPTPGSQFFPPSTESGEKPPAGLATPGTVPQLPAVPSVPQTPGIAPDPTSSTPILDSLKDPTAMKPAQGWSERLSEGLRDPAKYGLLAAGLSMMATPPREYPYSGGEIIGKAGLAGLGAFQDAATAKRRDQLAQAEADYRSARLEIEKQKLEAERKPASVISPALAKILGEEGLAGQPVDSVKPFAAAFTGKKGDKADIKRIVVGGEEFDVDFGDPEQLKRLRENVGTWKLAEERKEGTSAHLSVQVREDGTYIVNKFTEKATKVEGIPGAPRDPDKLSDFERKINRSIEVAQSYGWKPGDEKDGVTYAGAVMEYYRQYFGRPEDWMFALVKENFEKGVGKEMGPPKGPGWSGGESIPSGWKKTGKSKKLPDGTKAYHYVSPDGKEDAWYDQ